MLMSYSQLSKPFPISRHIFPDTYHKNKEASPRQSRLSWIYSMYSASSFFNLGIKKKIQRERQATWKQESAAENLGTRLQEYLPSTEKTSTPRYCLPQRLVLRR